LQKFSRFLYLPWPEGAVDAADERACSASHNGYARLGLTWKRTVRMGENEEIVVDDRIDGASGRRLTWHWLLTDRAWKMTSDQVEASDHHGRYRIRWHSNRPVRVSLLRADRSSAYGWWSPFYGEAEPACSLLIKTEADDDVQCETRFCAVN